MAVSYVILEKANPLDREAPKKFYAQAKSRGELTFNNSNQELKIAK